ncbi:MAG: thioesterase family protein [Solirubrobacterales bacterium]
MPPFRHSLRVRYNECDPQNVVFNANYLTYFDIAITELWREALGSYQQMLDSGVDVMVAEAGARFLAPARFDELLDVEATIERMGRTSMTTALRVTRDGEPVTEGELRHVFIDLETQAKREIPADIRRALARYADPDG